MSIDPVAIVGMAVRVPDAGDLAQFWENLLAGRDSIHRLTDEQLLAAGEDPELLAHPGYVRARPLLDDVAGFDHRFFGVSARESELRNPQHRLFLELCSTALQHGGYEPSRFDGAIGVYGGAAYDRYAEDHIRSDPRLIAQIGEMVANVSNNVDYLSTYVSYRLGLRGPSLSVRTACSTSLVAVHLACQAVRQGDCDMALAGGVEIEMPYGRGYVHVPGGIDSSDGRCRPLDARASGTVFGSGGGVVLLKRLDDALADGDTVLGVIRGSAMNNDGLDRAGFTAPSAMGQSRVISEALVVADVDPASVSYVELHGTGTVVGDPIEIAGLKEGFRLSAASALPVGSCAVGSVKSNIGHMGPASGVVGLVKTVLALQGERIPPTINVETPNPQLGLEGSPFTIADSARPWPRTPAAPRRGGVSSFGFGGTNVHVVVEEAPVVPAGEPSAGPELLVWSAVEEQAAAALRARLGSALAETAPDVLADVAFTLQKGRRALPVRSALVASGTAEAARTLADPAAALTASGDGSPRRAVLAFPGQGSQYPRAGAGLCDRFPEVGRRVRAHLAGFSDVLGIDLVRVWQEEADAEVVSRTVHAQPLLFSLELALAETLLELGVRPGAVTGHSVGELVAATVAGVFRPEDAIRVVARRAALMEALPPGRMLAVAAEEERVAGLLMPGVWISAVNAARQVVVGGAAEDLARFAEVLNDQGVSARELATSHAFHTPVMSPAVAELTEVVAACTLHAPGLPLVSAAAGRLLDRELAVDPGFWARQLVEPVRFHQALDALVEEPSLLVELGPGHALTSLSRLHAGLREGGSEAVSSVPPVSRTDDGSGFLAALARVWTAGNDLDWEPLWAGRSPRRVPLPAYPYQRRDFWLPAAAGGGQSDAAVPRLDLGAQAQVAPEPVAVEEVPASPADVIPDEPVTAYYGWEPAAVLLPVGPAVAGSRGTAVVVLPDAENRARDVVAAVQLAGYRAVPVRVGAEAASNGGVVRVRSGHPEDLVEVMRRITEQGTDLAAVVHARGYVDRPASAPDHDETLVEQGFWSVVDALQAVARHRRAGASRVSVTVLTTGAVDVSGAEDLVPARSTALGLVRSAALETGAGQARLVDARGVVPEVLAAALDGSSADGPVVAVRGHQLWRPVRRRLTLDGPSPALAVRKGVFLITGGLGAVGLAVARGLAEAGLRPRLVLLGRRAADETHVAGLASELDGLRSAGAEVELAAGDVAAPQAMAALVERIRARYGRLDGILHAAGVPGGGLLESRSREDAERVLRPKVTGSVVLRDLARGLPEAPFLLFFSSRAALNGLLGSADYAAANAFQDALATTSSSPDLVVRSVNWPAWRGTGMAALDPTRTTRAGEDDGRRDRISWRRRVEPGDWLMAEHVVGGRSTLPGTAYVDLLVRALQATPGVDDLAAVVIEDLVLVAPMLGTTARDVEVALTPDGAGWRAVVTSAEESSDSPVRHAEATLRVRPELVPPVTDLAVLVEGAEPVAPDEPAGDGVGFRFGPRFDCVRDLRQAGDGSGALLGRLALDESFEEDLDETVVHPALLDRAIGLRLSADGHVPFSCKRITVYSPVPATVVVRLVTRHRDARRLVVDAWLHDGLGRTVVQLEGLTKLAVPDGAALRGNGVPADVPAPAAGSGARSAPAPRRSASGIGLTSGVSVEEGVRTMLRLLTERAPAQVAVVPAREWTDPDSASPGGAAPAGETPTAAAVAVVPPQEGSAGGARHVPVPDTSPVAGQDLAVLWQEALGVPAVGPDDDFFELGGDSLTAVQLVSRLQDAFGTAISVADLFDRPTPAAMAAALLPGRAVRPATTGAPGHEAAGPMVAGSAPVVRAGAPGEVAVLAELWAEALGLPDVRPDDDFFELGGDSLTAVQLVSRIQDRFATAISVADLFGRPTPARLVELLR